jgi:ATP-dependent helicase/nuclease subunit B
VPARWLTRLDAMLAGQGLSLPEHPAAAWAAAVDLPDGGAQPVTPPTPRPPLALRPRKLSVTEIETWLRDPYAIHAKHILRLRKLDPIDQETDAADYGSLVHAGIHRFLARHGTKFPANAGREFRLAFAEVLKAANLRPALEAWWTPRLNRIADWISDTERQRRSEAVPEAISSELDGRWELADRRFTLTGRADRIERYLDGGLVILDYKTGMVPTRKNVETGLAPQLALEAAMARAGGFGLAAAGEIRQLAYWHLTGGPVPGERIDLFDGTGVSLADGIAEATLRLRARITAFDDPDCAYLSHPHPSLAPRFSDYAQLARVAEWGAGEDGDDA